MEKKTRDIITWIFFGIMVFFFILLLLSIFNVV